MYIPNAFSPNCDSEFKIFDRWGDHVFEYYNLLPSDPAYGWVGSFWCQEMGRGIRLVCSGEVFGWGGADV